MHIVLLGLAAGLAALGAAGAAAPAEAQSLPAAGLSSGHSSFHGDWRRDDRRDWRRDDRRGPRRDHRRRHRGFDGDVFLDAPEYQGDSVWRSNSFNDWWHDNPARNTPRWVRSNQDCQRQYWAGGGWRC